MEPTERKVKPLEHGEIAKDIRDWTDEVIPSEQKASKSRQLAQPCRHRTREVIRRQRHDPDVLARRKARRNWTREVVQGQGYHLQHWEAEGDVVAWDWASQIVIGHVQHSEAGHVEHGWGHRTREVVYLQGEEFKLAQGANGVRYPSRQAVVLN